MKKSTKILITTGLILGISSGVFAYGQKNHWGITPEDKLEFISERVTRKLDLNEIQQANLQSLASEVLDLMNEMHASREAHKAQIQAMLSEPVLDQVKALNLIQTKTSQLTDKAPAVIASLAAFLDSLDVEQKAKLQQFVDQRMNHRHRHGDHG